MYLYVVYILGVDCLFQTKSLNKKVSSQLSNVKSKKRIFLFLRIWQFTVKLGILLHYGFMGYQDCRNDYL